MGTVVYTPNVAYSAGWRFRGYMEYTTSYTSTTYTISADYGFYVCDPAYPAGTYPETHDGDPKYVKITGLSEYVGGAYYVSYSSPKNKVGTKKYTYTKTTEDQSATITVYVATTSAGSNVQSKGVTFTIPALASFNITFQSNGSAYTTKTCYYGKSVSLPSEPSLTGYTFKEWNTASNGTGTKVTSSTTFTKATTVYAIFTKNSYTLTATSTGPIETTGTTLTGNIASGTAGWTGSGNTATKVIPYNDQYSTLPVVSAVGHHATTWELTNGIDVSISTQMGAADTTIQPYWVRNTYTIIYDGNGNTGGSTASSSHTYNVPKTLTANGYTKTNYTFQGWATTQDKAAAEIVEYTDGKSVSNLTDSDNGEVTLYAVWKLNTRTLTLDANGGTINANSAWSGSGNIVTKTLTVGNPYGSLPWASLSRAGYVKKQNNSGSSGNSTTNTCWYTAKSGGNNVTSTITIENNNVTIYAQWTALTYTINFYKNGAEGTDINAITKTYEQSITLPSKPSNWIKTGYTFKGWQYGNSTIIYNPGSNLTTDLIVPQQNSSDNSITLKAVWEPNTYTLTFNDGHPASSSNYQGVTVPDSKTITYNSTYGSLPAPIVTTGEDDWGETHSFLGWYTSREGGVRRYDTDVVNTTTNITLYAHWQLLGVKSNVTDLRIYRSDENGNNDMTGQYATLDFTLLPGTNADGSTISKYNVTVKWKLSTATTYTTKTYTNVTNFNFHKVINTDILELKKYDVIITVTDGVGTITKNQIISSGSLLLDGFKSEISVGSSVLNRGARVTNLNRFKTKINNEPGTYIFTYMGLSNNTHQWSLNDTTFSGLSSTYGIGYYYGSSGSYAPMQVGETITVIYGSSNINVALGGVADGKRQRIDGSSNTQVDTPMIKLYGDIYTEGINEITTGSIDIPSGASYKINGIPLTASNVNAMPANSGTTTNAKPFGSAISKIGITGTNTIDNISYIFRATATAPQLFNNTNSTVIWTGYTTLNKPTASDVGAVSLTGNNTITGNNTVTGNNTITGSLTAPSMTETELNTFLDSLNRNFRGSVDWIVEENTDGIWTYRKWDSGIAECWCSASTSALTWTSYMASPSANPYLYYSSGWNFDLPFTLTDSSYVINATCLVIGPNFGWIARGSKTTSSFILYIIRNGNSGLCSVDINVKGRWK